VDYTNLVSLETPSLEGDVSTQLSLLKKAGFERVIVVDLTRPEIGIPVARVVIPKAEFRMKAVPHKPGMRARKQLRQIMLTEILQGRTS
jgi:ribosomal protein S12 methylthiotransferase accessory factor